MNSQVRRVYEAQKMVPVRQDWVLDLEKDKEEFGIVIEDSELKGKYKSRDSFKTFVK